MSNNALTLFSYNGSQVRTILDERTGEPWWVAKDVCAVLDIRNNADALCRLLPTEKGIERIYTPGGPQMLNIINKDGLYRLIFRSDKPIAEDFRTWIIKTVLPAVEKYGVPTAPQNPTALGLPDFTDPAASAVAWAEQYSARKTLEERNVVMVEKVGELEHDKTILVEKVEKLREDRDVIVGYNHALAKDLREVKETVKEAAPKVEAFEEFLDAEGGINYGEAAKLLKVAPKSLTRGLRDQGILFGNTRVTIAKQRYINKGYFKHLAGGNNGYVWTRSVLTPKGIEWLRGMYWVSELKEL